MRCKTHFALMTMAFVVLLSGQASSKEGPAKKAPSVKGTGKVLEWQSTDDLVYQYRVPKKYDHEKGAGLTLILHGSNLDRRWGFANHSSKSFRPDDIVVSPDGTTSNGRGGFNFLGNKKDAKRLHVLVEELKEIFNIRGTYVYGHSQGSFFAFYFAGEYPEDVQGVVGHASGVWNGTKMGRKGHGQAIVLMHGTRDPVVPYGQSEGGYQAFTKAKYPMLRLRSLEFWNHWPAEHNSNVPHTSQQLHWVEGMTTTDTERLAACFEFLTDVKSRERHDYAATYTLARRIEALQDAPDALRAQATDVKVAIEELADQQIREIGKDLPKSLELDDSGWSTHVMMFLRTFNQVPACEAFFEKHGKQLGKIREQGLKHLKDYYKALKKDDEGKAFKAGFAAIERGFLFHEVEGGAFLERMKKMRKNAKALKISKRSQKSFDKAIAALEKAFKSGSKSFDSVNKKHGKLP